MRNLFLKAKHWQLFILFTGIIVVLQFIWIVYFITNIPTGNDPTKLVSSVLNFFNLFQIISTISLGIYIALNFWYWSIATGLKSKLPENLKLNYTSFTIFLTIPIATMLILLLVLNSFINSIQSMSIVNEFPLTPFAFVNSFSLFIPLQILSIIAYFYCINFTAKVMKTVELQRATKFSDFVEEFFLLLFHFVGVWMLQPKIQKLLKGEIEEPEVIKTEILSVEKPKNTVKNTPFEDKLDDLI